MWTDGRGGITQYSENEDSVNFISVSVIKFSLEIAIFTLEKGIFTLKDSEELGTL